MSHHLVAITYRNDLPQLELFCFGLNQFWIDNKVLTLVVNSAPDDSNIEDIKYCKQVVSKIFDQSWSVTIVNGEMEHHNGYIEQAINKILFSLDPRYNDTIVFDTKDLLVRETGIDDFKKDNLYRAAYFITDKTHQDLYPSVVNMFDNDSINTLPATQNLTPWIWNNTQLQTTWNYLNDRFGDYKEWPARYDGFLPTGTEWDSYFAYTYITNNIFQEVNELIILGGVWTHQTYNSALQQEAEFLTQAHKKIWKHSRKVNDIRCFDVTKNILEHFSYPDELIKRWYAKGKEITQQVFE